MASARRRCSAIARTWLARLHRLHGDPQSHGLEDGHERAKRRIAAIRQRAVELRAIQPGALCHLVYAAEVARHLAQRDQQLGLVAVAQDLVQMIGRLRRATLTSIPGLFTRTAFHP